MDVDRDMPTTVSNRAFDRAAFQRLADWLAGAVAITLPWSTSVTEILIALWVLALLPTLDIAALRRAIALPAGAAVVALMALAVIGVLWADAPWGERFGGMRSFVRLLAIPLLLIQFHRSGRGAWVVGGFLASCTLLLAVSWLLTLFPTWQGRWGSAPGVPVKDYIVQSGEFLLCAFALAHLALTLWHEHRRAAATALAALAAAFLANIVFVATSRTSVVVFAVLLVVFAIQRLGWKGTLGILVGGAVLAAAAWASSPYLRSRILSVADEIRLYESSSAETSAGYRLEFWKKSIGFVAEAPFFGHGTGSTAELFRRAKTGDTGIAAAVTGNPHNQILLIAVELGGVGVAFLVAMWMAHGLLFRAAGLPAWLGLGVVVQNIVSSLSNAQLFYFTPGWTYVFGVGVLGGMVLAAGETNSGRSAAPSGQDRAPTAD